MEIKEENKVSKPSLYYNKNILRLKNTCYFVANFTEPVWENRPIKLKLNGEEKAPQLRQYTSFAKLQKANIMDDLF